MDDTLIIGEQEILVKKPKIPNYEIKNESVKITKDDVLLSLYKPNDFSSDKTPEKLNEINRNQSIENKRENSAEPSIVTKKFYPNEKAKSVQILEEPEVFNESIKKPLLTPKSNLKRRRDDENSQVDKNKSKSNTPKRNISNENSRQIRTTPSMNTRAMKRLNIDSENQENKIDDEFLKSPVKTWNRNNSKTFLKG